VQGKALLYKTEGIIIKKTNFGEFDRLLTIYTKDFGKLLVKVKSVRKEKAKLKGHLELFNHSHLMIAPGRGFDIVTGAETINGFFDLRQNTTNLSACYYFCELIDKLISGQERDERIWSLLLLSFEELGSSPLKQVTNNFEKNIINFLGYGNYENDFIDFVQSLLKEPIKSHQLLTECYLRTIKYDKEEMNNE